MDYEDMYAEYFYKEENIVEDLDPILFAENIFVDPIDDIKDEYPAF